jgi:hypothetical protein
MAPEAIRFRNGSSFLETYELLLSLLFVDANELCVEKLVVRVFLGHVLS